MLTLSETILNVFLLRYTTLGLIGASNTCMSPRFIALQDDTRQNQTQMRSISRRCTLALRACINFEIGFSTVILVFKELDSLQGQPDSFFCLEILRKKPPLKLKLPLVQWQKMYKEAEKKRLLGQTQHLEARYKLGDKVYL